MDTLQKKIQTVQNTMKGKVKFSPDNFLLLRGNHTNRRLSISPCKKYMYHCMRYSLLNRVSWVPFYIGTYKFT